MFIGLMDDILALSRASDIIEHSSMAGEFIGVLDFLKFILEDCFAHNNKPMNKDLLIKYDKDPYFKKEVDVNQERYQALEQAAAYSDLSAIPLGILQHIKSRNIYFYFGYQQPTSRKYIPKLAMYLAKNFRPQPKQSYTFVFFNEFCPDNYVLWNFREVFATLRLEQVAAIDEFIVVKPYFYHKAMDWMTYGTVAKFLKSKTRFINSYTQLCKHLILSQEALLDYVPRNLYQNECPQLYERSLMQRPLVKGESGKQNGKQINQKMKMLKDIVVKPGQEVNRIEDYEISEIGVPVILKMLVFALQSNEQGLLTQGLFRKSVSIDDLTENVNEFISKNYDYLLEIKNPHTIANLIKKFFSSLKVPVFPFADFQKLMLLKDLEFIKIGLKEVVHHLPNVNQASLTLLINFLRRHILPKEDLNKMGVQNLAICFAPCWFRSESSSALNELMYASKAVVFAKFCIEDFDNIFGTEEERQDLYRKSYYDSKKSFQDELDIGLEQTLRIVQQSNPGAVNARCSSRYSHKFPVNLEQEIMIFAAQEHNQQQQEKEIGHQEIFETLLEDEPQKEENNPRFSKYRPEYSEKNRFLSMIDDTEQPADNPRFSRNAQAPAVKQEQEEVDGDKASIDEKN